MSHAGTARVLGTLIGSLSLLAGCANGRINPTATNIPATQGPRIISLAPSLTEIAFAIGCGGSLVADTTYDDYPPAAKGLPHVADLAHADLERIARLRPNIVIAVHDQEHEGGPIQARLGIPVTYLPNRNLDDLYADIAGVAQACDRAPRGAALTAQIRQRLKSIEARPLTTAHRPRVFFLLGLPGFTAGKSSFINDLIVLAGGENIAGQVDQPYPDLGAEAILQADPDIIIVSKDTPFGPDVRAREPWRSLRAVQRGRVVRPPNDSIVERNGPRVVDGLEWLSAQFR